jgi:threonyl-tRNA synthetase
MEDFQKLNSELGLWDYYEEAGRSLPHWLPNGALIRSAIEDFWKQEHLRKEYNLVYTPHIGTKELWVKSGHMDRFSEKMYPAMTVDSSEEYILRPMNCPFHILLYKSEPRTYKQMPIRYAELGTVYRKIPSGSSKHTFEVRGFTQDDAHIFCEQSRVQKEIANLIEFTVYFLQNVFKLNENDYRIIRRLKPRGGIGSDVSWDNAQRTLQKVLNERGINYKNEPGKGVFYGPKIDFEITDPIYKKQWICSTIQLDIVLAGRFGLVYKDSNNQNQVPMIIHRTILGSLERFVSILLARTKGHFPIWIAPCQAIIIPVGGKESEYFEANLSYAKSIKTILEDSLRDLKPRIKVSLENKDIREAKAGAISQKVPYIIVVGGNERINDNLTISSWNNGAYTSEPRHLKIKNFADEVRTRIQDKT